MSARILIVKNIGREGPGLLRDVLMHHRIEADVVEIERGESIPALDNYRAMVVLGGPADAYSSAPEMVAQVKRARQAIDSDFPYLGICLGHQVLAVAAGETVAPAAQKEIGFSQVSLTEAGHKDQLFDGLDKSFPVFQLHGDEVKSSVNSTVLATGGTSPVQAIRVGRRAYGLQMHFELVPEMLAVWCAQDADLKDKDAAEFQRQYAAISDSYIAVGKKLFSNFLTIADLASIDLTESERANVK